MNPELIKAAEQIKDPFYFMENILGIEQITDEQIEIIKSVWNQKYTDVKSCHTIGKTYILAAILISYLYTHENSVVITTAPTGRQVRDLLWREVNNFHSNAKVKLGGKCNVMNLNIDAKWYATGIATEPGKESESAIKIQGYHAPDILIIADEAFGIQRQIYEALDGVGSSEGARFLAVGNPSSTNNAYALELQKSGRKAITISAFNHPNVKEKKTVIPGAVSYTWVMDKIRDWCEPMDKKIDHSCFEYEGQIYKPSDLFRWKVLGEYPLQAVDSLVSYQELLQAMETVKDKEIGINNGALDVARFGSDKSVFTHDKNNHYTFKEFYKMGVADLTGEAMKFIIDTGIKKFGIDCDGIGGGVYDNLKALQKDGKLNKELQLIEIHSGSSPLELKQTEQFLNLRAQMFWQLRTDINEMSMQYKEDLLIGLSSIKYFFNSRNGKIQIESKDDFKKRFKRSSDYEDSLAYCHFLRFIRPVKYSIGRVAA